MNININGLSQYSSSLLANYALKSEIDIIGITETKRNQVHPKEFPGYEATSRRSATFMSWQGGVALFWRTEKTGTPIDGFSNGEIDEVFVIFKLLGRTFLVGCFYIKPEQKHENETLKNIFLKST